MNEPAGKPAINTAIDFKVSQGDLIDLIVVQQEEKLLKVQEGLTQELNTLKAEAKEYIDSINRAAQRMGKQPLEVTALKKTFPTVKVIKRCELRQYAHNELAFRSEKVSMAKLVEEGKVIKYVILRDREGGYNSRPIHQTPKANLKHTCTKSLVDTTKSYVKVKFSVTKKENKKKNNATNFDYNHSEKIALTKSMIGKYEKYNKLLQPIADKEVEVSEIRYQLAMLNSDSKKYKTKMVQQILSTTEEGKAILEMAEQASLQAFVALPEGKG